MHKLLPAAILLLQCHMLLAQENQLPFSLEGNINADTGVVALEILVDTDYYPQGVEKMVAKVKNKKFFFSGNIPYPQGVRITYSDVYYSSPFVIEPGTQSITVNIDSVREVPKVDNQAMQEYEKAYTEAFQPVWQKRELLDKKRDSLGQLYQNNIPDHIKLDLEQQLKGYYAKSDSTLLSYVSRHPNSYIAFWKFIYLFSGFGYESIFDSILAQFSDSLKSTHAGKVLIKKLNIASSLDYGKEFPPVAAVDIDNNKLDYTSFLKNQYTFVDFWYSNCGPCIAQFPHLKETYEQYKDKGFEIIGISTDRERYRENWQKAIEKYQLSWPQYWDRNGEESSKLSINKFPTNYLLDSQGRIIKKDLRPVELEQFLQDNI